MTVIVTVLVTVSKTAFITAGVRLWIYRESMSTGITRKYVHRYNEHRILIPKSQSAPERAADCSQGFRTPITPQKRKNTDLEMIIYEQEER